MSLLNWWKSLWVKDDELAEAEEVGPTRLPTEPLVFDCRECHKTFEARRKHPACPECGSEDVEELG